MSSSREKRYQSPYFSVVQATKSWAGPGNEAIAWQWLSRTPVELAEAVSPYEDLAMLEAGY